MGNNTRFWLTSGFLITLAWNACSPVRFAANTDDSQKPLCIPGPGVNCGQVVSKEKTITVRAPTTEVDVLVIVDDSGSMEVERDKLAARMKTFLDNLNGLSWRVCLTTTAPVDERQGKLYNFINGDSVLTSASTGAANDVNADGVKNYEDIFLETMDNITSISGSGSEQGIAAAGYTIANENHNCFRDTAALAIVLLSDEDEKSTGGWPKYEDHSQYRALAEDNWPKFVFESFQTRFNDDQKPMTYNSIVIKSGDKACYDEQSAQIDEDGNQIPAFYGTRYEEMSRQSGGIVGDICADDYGAQLAGIADRVKKTLQAVTLECAPTGEPVVTVSSGMEPYTIQGNKVVFQNALTPGTVVTVKYYCTY